MALDERRISTRAKLKVNACSSFGTRAIRVLSCIMQSRRSLQESYLQAERQKAVMFATLNRVRQSLQDQGAQVVHRYHKALGPSCIC